ncbi:MAG: hypothetical protein V4726_19165 [Verrucomicrobiota bacterium]
MFLKLLRRILIALFGLFLVLEAVLWIFVRTPREPLKRLDLSNRIPGLKKDVRFSFDRVIARYLDDKNGSKPSGTVRILCLGGSGTLAMLQNAEDSWWGQLGRLLQEKGLPVEVAAWGQDKAGIVTSTAVAAQLIEDWRPDVVIGNFGFDDVVSQPLNYTYDPGKAQHLSPPPRPAGWKEAVITVSQTARLGRLWARNSEASMLQNTLGRPDHYKDVFETMKQKLGAGGFEPLPARPVKDDPLKEYLDGWKILETLAKRHGATLIMTGEPALDDATINRTQMENLIAIVLKDGRAPLSEAKFLRPDPTWVERELQRYGDAAEKLAAESGIPWLDLNGRVPRSLDHFFSDVMLTDEGAAAAARLLLPTVEPVVKARAGK